MKIVEAHQVPKGNVSPDIFTYRLDMQDRRWGMDNI